MTTDMISISSQPDQHFSGYLATPKSNRGPGIILIQEIFGINKTIRALADRFANEGYTVLAPDLFWRLKPNIQLSYEGKDLDKAFDYYHRFDTESGLVDLGESMNVLRNHPSCSGKIATLGFCLGGKLSYLSAAQYSPDAAIAFYGGGIADHLKEAQDISCPLLMHFGADDEMIPSEQIERIKETFHDRTNVEIYVYPQVGHAFYNFDRKSYNPKAADLAHERTIKFLRKTIG